MLATSEEPPERSAELLRQQIANVIADARGGSLPLDNVESFVAVGGDARFAAREIGKPTGSADLVRGRPRAASTSWCAGAASTPPRSWRKQLRPAVRRGRDAQPGPAGLPDPAAPDAAPSR